MSINTKRVQGRRSARYESLEALLEEARSLAASDVAPLGNWSIGQVYEHLARSLDSSIDGAGFALPAPVRWMMTLLMKRKFLKVALPAGFQTTAAFEPDETAADVGLASLEAAVARQRVEGSRAMHPAFGRISREEWNEFHLRHAELHMSFLVPAAEGAAA